MQVPLLEMTFSRKKQVYACCGILFFFFGATALGEPWPPLQPVSTVL
jgi:hypothetical protein